MSPLSEEAVELNVQGREERALGSLAPALAPSPRALHLDDGSSQAPAHGQMPEEDLGNPSLSACPGSSLPPRQTDRQTLTTPSSAGALSPTTSITGQLGDRGQGSGRGLGQRQGGTGRRAGVTHRSVLALGTVPGRLMSRSLRLWGRGEGKEGIPGADPNTVDW